MASKVRSQVPQLPVSTVQHQRASVPCACGCGTLFTPLRPNHRFVDDHRFVTYQSHACPDCGSTHRIAVKRDLCKVCGLHYGAHHSTSVGDDPRDSSIDIVREQRQ